MSNYSPPLEPAVGRFVLYWHETDRKLYPGLILDIQDDGPLSPSDSRHRYWTCMLQVFRPRGNEWRWAAEGKNWGSWSWPDMKTSTASEITRPGWAQGLFSDPPPKPMDVDGDTEPVATPATELVPILPVPYTGRG